MTARRQARAALVGAGVMLATAGPSMPTRAEPADATCVYLGLGCRSVSPPPLPTPLPGPLYPPAPIAPVTPPPSDDATPADAGEQGCQEDDEAAYRRRRHGC